MRTKALILSAALCAIGATSTLAQNVYSVNVVGYTTVTLSNSYSLIGNQLTDGAFDYATNHIPAASVAQNTQIAKFNPATGLYSTLNRGTNGAGVPVWTGPGSAQAMTMGPGEGVWLKKSPLLGTATATITFVGEVMQGELHNPVILGYDIYAPMVPQAGGIATTHGFTPQNGDQVYRWLPTGIYQIRTYSTNTSSWGISEPTLGVNEAVWIKTLNPAGHDWVRTFTVQ